MSKTRTPFFGLGAHGSVGGSITTQKRRAETLVRTKPFPAYRLTLPQQYQRWLYEDYAYLWTQQSQATRQTYATGGSKLHLTGFQYWMKYHLSTLPDILGWWKLDHEGSGIATDSSKNNNNGTVFGATPITGQIAEALHFDALNDYIDCGDTLFNLLQTSFTIHYFVKFTTTSEVYIVSKLDSAPTWRGYRFGVIDGKYRFYMDDGPSSLEFTGAIQYNDYAWHHFAFVGTGNNCLVYVDGDYITTHNYNALADLAPIQSLLIGASEAGAARNFDGQIDNVLFYNRQLDAVEVERWANRHFETPSIDVIPPPPDIDIGSPAVARLHIKGPNTTYIVKDNPANATGIITTVKINCWTNLTGLRVGTFYKTNGNTLKCRDSVVIGNVVAGAERTFPGLSLAVQTGDYIGHYWTGGDIYISLNGFNGYWSLAGEHIDPADEGIYTLSATRTCSLWGEN